MIATGRYHGGMPTSTTPPRNWFDQGGQAYARFRPDYPPELGARLASMAPAHGLAVDVGCGNGQLTQLLAPRSRTPPRTSGSTTAAPRPSACPWRTPAPI
jgi:SAM-dependent methyltransferase